MKISHLSLWILLTGLSPLAAQDALDTSTPEAVDRGPHSTTWQRVTPYMTSYQKLLWRTNRYVELGAGLNRLNNGVWVPATETVEIFQDAAVARGGQHTVTWEANFNTAGLVDLISPDGIRFRSHVLGIAYTDSYNGKSTLIAEPKDCVGKVGGNVVLYQDAFAGPFWADVRFTYTVSGFEQDIVFQESPPSPADYGLDPATTRLEIWTEFLDAPTPTTRSSVLEAQTDPLKRKNMVDPDLTDQFLDFGTMQIGSGGAFMQADQPAGLPGDEGTAFVGKSWVVLDGRTFLIEKINFATIKDQFDRLPKAAAVRRAQDKNRMQAAIQPQPQNKLMASLKLPKPKPAQATRPWPRMAAITTPARGFVLDYALVNSVTNWNFQGDTTYYVSNKSVTISGTLTIEGGSVIKFSRPATGVPPQGRLLIQGPIDCRTSQYLVATFTGQDDDTVGEVIVGSTGSMGTNKYTTRTLDLGVANTTYDLHDLRLRNQDKAIAVTGSNVTYTLSHSQISSANIGLYHLAQVPKAFLRNVLITDVTSGISMGTSTNSLEHVTIHRMKDFRNSTSAGLVSATNSLLICVTNNITFVGSGSDVISNLSDSGVFQTVGAGSRYLATGSSYRDVGVTTINSALLADLRKRTTYPPILITNDITTGMTIGPSVGRDVDTPDLGYHYDCLDVLLGGIALTNVTLVITNGATVGIDASVTNYGLRLDYGSSLVSQGSPDNLNRFVRTHCVQELPSGASNNTAPFFADIYPAPSSPASARFRFTDFPLLANSYLFHHEHNRGTLSSLALQDSHVRGGILLWSGSQSNMTVTMTNCLFDRVRTEFYDYTNSQNSACNTTFHGGSVLLLNVAGSTWAWRNILFDGTTNSQTTITGTFTGDYNGYTTNLTRLTPNGSHDVLLTVTNLTYDTGALGRFYLPTNVTTQSGLFNAGSTNANYLGLYHFTTTTNQFNETNSVVDLGFHYVAVNSSGLPIDTDGDGLPDYLEDTNGNGVLDSGETNPNNASDLGLKVQITRPRIGTLFP